MTASYYIAAGIVVFFYALCLWWGVWRIRLEFRLHRRAVRAAELSANAHWRVWRARQRRLRAVK